MSGRCDYCGACTISVACEDCAGDTALMRDLAAAQERIRALEGALQECLDFARRNDERATRYAEQMREARKSAIHDPTPRAGELANLAEEKAWARAHEAARVLAVLRDRARALLGAKVKP